MTGGKFTRRVSAARFKASGTSEGGGGPEGAPEGAPLGGTKSEAAQRLQVGLFGIGAMVLLVGLANVLGNQADRTEEGAVPDAAPTTEPAGPAPQRDPLADAGIVPDIPAEPTPVPATDPLDLEPASREDSELTADVAPQN